MIKVFTLKVNGQLEAIDNQRKLTEAIKATKKEMQDKHLRGEGYKEAQKELAKLQTLQKQLRDAQRKANRERELELGKSRGSYRALNAELVKLRNDFKTMSAQERKAFGKDTVRRIQALDKQLKQLDAQMGLHQRSVGNYSLALGGLGKAAGNLGRGLLAGFGVHLGITAVTSALKGAYKITSDYEEQLKKLSSITGLTGADLEQLGARAIQMTERFGDSASEILDGFALVGSAKPELLKDAAALAEVTKQANILAKAGGLDLSTAVDALTKGLNQFGEGADRAAEFTDILATSQQLGASRVEQLAEGLKVVGSVANIVGIEFNQLNGAQQALAKGGIEGAEAGTKLRNIFLALVKTGRKDLNPQYTDFNDILETLSLEIQDAGDAVEFFDKRNAGAAITLIENRDLYKSISENVNDLGNAQRQAATNTDTNRIAIAKLSAEWKNLVLAIDEGDGDVSNAVKNTTGYFTDFLRVARGFVDGDVNYLDLNNVFKYGDLADTLRANTEKEIADAEEELSREDFTANVVIKGAFDVSTPESEIIYNEEETEEEKRARQLKELLKEEADEKAKENKKAAEKRKKYLQEQAKLYNDHTNDLVQLREKNLISAQDYAERVKEAEIIDAIEGYDFLLRQAEIYGNEREEIQKSRVDAQIKLQETRNKRWQELNKEILTDTKATTSEALEDAIEALDKLAVSEQRGKDSLESDTSGTIGLFQEQALERFKEGLTDAAGFEQELEQARLREHLLYLDARLASDELTQEQELELLRERASEELKLEKQTISEVEKLRQEANESLKNLGKELINTLFASREASIERQREEDVREAEYRLESEADFYGQSSALRERAAEETAKKVKAINDKANKEKKRNAILQAVINGALAAGQALANTSLIFPASLLALIPVAAATAANIATISGVGFDEGGFTHGIGLRDSKGLEISQINPDGSHYHVDEYVVPSKVKNTGRGRALIEQLDAMRFSMGYRARFDSKPKGFAEGGFNDNGSNPFATPLGGQATVTAMVQLPDEALKKQAAIIAVAMGREVRGAMTDALDSAARNAERKGRQEAQTLV